MYVASLPTQFSSNEGGSLRIQLMETGTAAEFDGDDFYGDGTNAPDYYCSSRKFAKCCDVRPSLQSKVRDENWEERADE